MLYLKDILIKSQKSYKKHFYKVIRIYKKIFFLFIIHWFLGRKKYFSLVRVCKYVRQKQLFRYAVLDFAVISLFRAFSTIMITWLIFNECNQQNLFEQNLLSNFSFFLLVILFLYLLTLSISFSSSDNVQMDIF